ncbi:MAG TPA: DUF167 domain-containing protein [Bacillota bacterium]
MQLREVADGVVVPVRVQPRSSRSKVGGTRGGALVVRVTAPPVEGEANRALLVTVADWLGVRRSQVTLVAGETSRQKRVLVTGITQEAVADAVSRLSREG